MPSINRRVKIQRLPAKLARTAAAVPFRAPRPSLGLTVDQAQANFHFHVRTLQDPEAVLVGCSYVPGLAQSSTTGRGSVFLDYLLEGRRLSIVQAGDDDPDGPLTLVIKPEARRWSRELIAGSEYAVLRTEDGRRFSSVNWKTQDGVVIRAEPSDIAGGMDQALLTRVLDGLQ